MQVNTKQFLSELRWAARFVEPKTTIPILNNVLLEASKGRLSLTATDLEVAGVSQLTGQGKGDFAVAVPPKQLIRYLEKVDDDTLDLAAGENHWFTATHNGSSSRVAGMSKESYPELPAIPTTAHLAGFAAAIPRVLPAVSADEGNRFSFHGALLESDADGARLVATDAHRLSISAVQYDGGPKRALLRRRTLSELAALNVEQVAVGFDENHVRLVAGDRQIVARNLTGNFPDWQRVVAREFPSHAFIPAKQTLKILERVATYASELNHAVRFEIGEGKLTISSSTCETGEAKGVIPLTGGETATPVTIGLNATYVVGFLRQADKQVAFCWRDESSMVQFMDESGWVYALMVMRI